MSLLARYGPIGKIAYSAAALYLLYILYEMTWYVEQDPGHEFASSLVRLFNLTLTVLVLLGLKYGLRHKLRFKRADTPLLLVVISLSLIILISVRVTKMHWDFYQQAKQLDLFGMMDSSSEVWSTSMSSAILLLLLSLLLPFFYAIAGYRTLILKEQWKPLFTLFGVAMILSALCSLLSIPEISGMHLMSLFMKAVWLNCAGALLHRMENAEPLIGIAESGPELHRELRPTESIQSAAKRASNEASSEEVAPIVSENINPPSEEPPAKSEGDVELRSKPKAMRTASPKKKEKSSFFSLEKKEEVIPSFNVEEHKDRDLIKTYYNELSEDEKRRLETIVAKTDFVQQYPKQLNNEVLRYIAEERPFDHGRYAPGLD